MVRCNGVAVSFMSVGRRNPGWLIGTIVTPYLINPKYDTNENFIYFPIGFFDKPIR
jgi:hypothetical protein